MSELTPRLALPLIAASQAQKHVPVNEALARLDALVQIAVLDRALTAPPAEPPIGARYIVGSGATGDWTGHEGKIAAYDAGWTFAAPREGWLVWDEAAAEFVVRVGDIWQVFSGGSGGSSELQNLTLLGLGSEADGTNPFSAKLNNALWTARTSGEGGTGDLRYVMNKDTSANVLSLLMQSGYGGRAEIGLIGDDHLQFKVSADGAVWREALRIDKTTGRVRFPQGGTREQLSANRTYYVRTDGSDSNEGLANTSVGAFLTIQKAVDVAAALDGSIFNVTVQVGPGTWTAPIVLPAFIGSGTWKLLGDAGIPSNVLISTSGTAITANVIGRAWVVDGFKIQTTGSGSGIAATKGASIEYQNIDFGACGVAHIAATTRGSAIALGNTMISGNALIHWYVDGQGFIQDAGRTITLSGTRNFSNAFAQASGMSMAKVNNNTFAGSATGVRYLVSTNSFIDANGGGANYLPGSSAGSMATGGQYF